MGKLQVLGIIFRGNQDVYKPGDTIHGEVQIVLNEEIRDIRGVQIKCIGKSVTSWSQTEGSGNNETTVQYNSCHEYFKQEVVLRGVATSNSRVRMTMPAGEHRFPFRFQIPSMVLPAPFEGDHGYVRYFVQVRIDRPWRFDHHTQRLFSILSVKDLNYEPNVLVPPSNQIEKTVCCLCCASGPIVLIGQIDKRGYAPGEYILVSLDLNNNSSRTIVDFTVRLVQRAQFIAHASNGRSCQKVEIKQMAELRLDGCEAMGSMNYERKKMLVPPIPPCTYDDCPNINLEYYIEIEAGVSGTLMDAEVQLPIVIGTIPAFQHTVQYPSQAPQGMAAYAPSYPPLGQPAGITSVQTGYSHAHQQANPSLGQPNAGLLPPPPTYAAAVGGPKVIAGEQGSFGTVMYAPQYPYYDPDTLYNAMGIPQGSSSPDVRPTINQPQSIQQPL